jgi:ABC-type phosphate transport system auxiliary subunit
MKANNLNTIIAIMAIIGLTVALADNPKPIDPKEKELNELLKKSQERLKKVNFLIKKIDNVATEKVVEMKEDIVMLQEEKKVLQEEKQQLTIELNETKAIVDSIAIYSSPFKLVPIVSDSTN